MHAPRDSIRQSLALTLTALMLTLSVAVPMLERGGLLEGPVVESEHDASACPGAHDHSVCAQVGANAAAGAAASRSPTGLPGVLVATVGSGADTPSATYRYASPSRAPPLV